jgi:hypothetical protein
VGCAQGASADVGKQAWELIHKKLSSYGGIMGNELSNERIKKADICVGFFTIKKLNV